ncbi:hypothetical protein HDU76_002596 [Blyttiomyces sp. JEL0837]|nr:hypothetical protein HDU76_002596 [Blyttiomyces sp. JEL0837]
MSSPSSVNEKTALMFADYHHNDRTQQQDDEQEHGESKTMKITIIENEKASILYHDQYYNNSLDSIPTKKRSSPSYTTKALLVIIALFIVTQSRTFHSLFHGGRHAGSEGCHRHRYTTSNVAKFHLDSDVLDADLEQLRIDSGTLGSAVAIVQDGEIVYGKGFGKKNLKGDVVTTKTLFQIGSTTKAFTSFAALLAHDQGLLNLTTPVTELYPLVSFKDPSTNANATLLDLLSHVTGIPRYDMLGLAIPQIHELISRIQYLTPTAPFRDHLQYNNWMYSLTGAITANVTGYAEKDSTGRLGWDQMVQENVLDRLGMTDTVTDFGEMFEDGKDFSDGFVRSRMTRKLYEVERETHKRFNGYGPAGTIASNLEDMAKWCAFILNNATLDGTPILNPETFKLLVTPRTEADEIQGPAFPETTADTQYALGWMISGYRNHSLVHHGGATFGFLTNVVLIPEENTAIITFDNSRSVFNSIAYRVIIDRLFHSDDETPIGWTARFQNLTEIANQETHEAEELINNLHIPSIPPLSPISKIIGTYFHPAYGNLTLTLLPPTNNSNETNSSLQFSAQLDLGSNSYNGKPATFILEHWIMNAFAMRNVSFQSDDIEPTINELNAPVTFAFLTVSIDWTVPWEPKVDVEGLEMNFEGFWVDFEKVDGDDEGDEGEDGGDEEEGFKGLDVVAGEKVAMGLEMWVKKEKKVLVDALDRINKVSSVSADQILSLSNPPVRTYALTSSLLTLKLAGLGLATALTRVWVNNYGCTEDRILPWLMNLLTAGRWAPVKTVKDNKKEIDCLITQETGKTHVAVEALNATLSNDVANVPVAIAMGGIFLLVAKPTPAEATRIFGTLLIGRYVQTLAGIAKVQPFRTVGWMAASLSTVEMAIRAIGILVAA